jgi:hypothetical protein
MIHNQHDERRNRGLLTQAEICEHAKCSAGRLQYHTRRGLIAEPKGRLHSRYYYTPEQAQQIRAYFAGRKPWQRVEEVQDE